MSPDCFSEENPRDSILVSIHFLLSTTTGFAQVMENLESHEI